MNYLTNCFDPISYAYGRNNDFHLISCTKINSRWIKDLFSPKPLERKLPTQCPLTPKHFSMYSLEQLQYDKNLPKLGNYNG